MIPRTANLWGKCLVTCGLIILNTGARAETGFLQALSPEDFAGAGLQKQTPAELARLELLIERHRPPGGKTEGSLAVAPQRARPEPGSAASPAKKPPGWLAAVLTLNRAAEKPEQAEPLASRLVGNFAGWHGRTVFRLENGTTWVQQNSGDTLHYSPVLPAPNVVIRPASLGGFWLEIAGVNKRLRVLPDRAQR